jgi:uncharacterized membrane protein YcaP (DUF421 family)
MNFHFLKNNFYPEIDWLIFLLGSEKWTFLPEVALRSLLMFLVILFSLRILGKRSVTQLSVFEMGVIIGLGSAAGDPMFYKDVGMLSGVMAFVVVISLYRFMTFLINRSDRVERVLEGKPVYAVEHGKINFTNFKKEVIGYDEFFSLLRQHSVSHIGQVQLAIIETNGTASLYYFSDEEVRWGLPILPHLYNKRLKGLPGAGPYACTRCGQVEDIKNNEEGQLCQVCGNDKWVLAVKSPRTV